MLPSCSAGPASACPLQGNGRIKGQKGTTQEADLEKGIRLDWIPDGTAFLTSFCTLGFAPGDKSSMNTPARSAPEQAEGEGSCVALGNLQLLTQLLTTVCRQQVSGA